MRATLKQILVTALLLGSISTLRAQVTIDEEVETDSIDIFAYKEPDKKPGTAMFASILLPGLGHQYLGKPRRAIAYFTAEAFFIFGLAYSESYSRKLFFDSEVYAWQYAGVPGGTGADDFFWQNVGKFMDSDEYNRILELNRTDDIGSLKYVGDNLQWRWPNDSLREEYNELRSRATRYHVTSNFFLVGMLLNRVVAFIDARVSTKYKGIRSSFSVQPSKNQAFTRYRLAVTKEF
ncbi:MAG: hypothetical protein GF401_02120 [Chitinivibrionales bacterium]|nr:hypothetical protein [Chitinivibrionales bacterium]